MERTKEKGREETRVKGREKEIKVKRIKKIYKIIGISILLAFLVFIDRITKTIYFSTKCFWIFCITQSQNYGLWLGLFSSIANKLALKYAVFFLSMIVIFALFLLLVYFAKSTMAKFGVVLIVAGVVGNLIDRAFYGYVTDWLSIKTLTFNLADCYITFGILFFVVFILKKLKKIEKRKT